MEAERTTGEDEAAVAGVVVDIGADIGALVVYTPEHFNGLEIEVSPADDGPRTHTIVRPRRLPHAVTHAAVFPRLAAGRYTLLGIGTIASSPVTITGGTVTEMNW